MLAAAPEFAAGDVVGGRFGDLVDAGPAWVGHVRRAEGVTHVRVDLDDIPADGPLPVRVRIGGTWLSADYAAAPLNPDGQLPLLDWAADTVTFSRPDPDGAPVEFDVGGRRVAEADAGGPGRARLLIAHFCIQAINDLLEEPFDGYVPPRTYMQVTMADEDGRYSSRPGAERINPGGYRDGLTMHRRFGVPYHLALNGGVLVLTAHDCPDDLAAMRADLDRGPHAPGDRGLRVAPHPVLLGRGERPRHHRGRRGHHDLPRRLGAAARRVLPRPTALPAAACHGRGAADRRPSATSCSTRPPATTTTPPPSSRPARATTSAPACCGPTARAARTCCSSTPR